MFKLMRFLRAKSIVPLAVACMFLVPALCSRAQSSALLDKHARRIEKRLAKYRQGTVLDFEFRDSSKTFGALGPMLLRLSNSLIPTATRSRRIFTPTWRK